MTKQLIGLLCLVRSILISTICEGKLTYLAVRLPLEGNEAAPGAPWPMPRRWTENINLKTIDPNTFSFTSDTSGCDVIDAAFARYKEIIKLDDDGVVDSGLNELVSLHVTITEPRCEKSYYPPEDMDESYTLDITNTNQGNLQAATIWAALRGLETFSQLIFLTDDKKYHINQTHIDDAPRYPFRGLHIDTARHFIHVPILLQALDAMSWDKINVFHWHVVDDQSFPYPLRSYPNMTVLGAYTPYHKYSRDDVSTLLEAARLRGIRVIPEFDTPGHTASWGKALPRLITPCWGQGESGGPNVPDFPNHGAAEIINPMEEYTYSVLGDIYDEIIEDFPDKFVHLGMDEVYYACWMSNPNMTAWMVKMNFTDYKQVEGYFQHRLINIVEGKGSKFLIWQDPIDHGVTVSTNSLIVAWKDSSLGRPGEFDLWQDYVLNITTLGYNTILSSPWYLNMIKYGQEWKELYEVEPSSFTDDATLQAHIKGGQACMWMAYGDGTNVLPRLWPRMSAVAERLWSPASVNNTNDAQFRLDQQRCRFVRRGLPAQPILNGYCGDYEWGERSPEVSSASFYSLHHVTALLVLLILLC